MATIDDFRKLDLRIAEIKEVNEHPNAYRLYVITVDFGDRTKQVVAGIRNSYKKEELVGREVVVVDNLEPAMLRGVESLLQRQLRQRRRGQQPAAGNQHHATGS